MRNAPALLVLVLVVGCGGSEVEPPRPVVGGLAGSQTATPTPTARLLDPTKLTAVERAYLQAAYGVTSRDGATEYSAAVLEEGRALCGKPPTAEWIVHNSKAEDKRLAAAIEHLCPLFLDGLREARVKEQAERETRRPADLSFGDGVHRVGEDIMAGTYTTTGGRTADCHWEQSSVDGDILDSDVIRDAPKELQVTVRTGESFKSQGCGTWAPA
ncbi:hypothetical protein [Herbidospora daliensis]|uniref:hypothetical protein n=1 Tax=Herbidospora daliensis TaxID=295585 RepID=UPI0007833DB6|nr:hypothetical protein [Herbidospora daliensis]